MVGEQPVYPEGVARAGRGSRERPGRGIADEDGAVGARVVAQRRGLVRRVLADHPQEDGARYLVLDLEAWHPDLRHDAAVVRPVHLLVLIEQLRAELRGRAPGDIQILNEHMTARPLEEILI